MEISHHLLAASANCSSYTLCRLFSASFSTFWCGFFLLRRCSSG